MNERGNLTKELLSYILQKDSLNFHKRLSIQSLIFANSRPMFTSCQHYYFTVRRMFYNVCGEVSAENTKYAEHYTSYGYSFRIYGYFEEKIKAQTNAIIFP